MKKIFVLILVANASVSIQAQAGGQADVSMYQLLSKHSGY
jgi:hypothetical protein